MFEIEARNSFYKAGIFDFRQEEAHRVILEMGPATFELEIMGVSLKMRGIMRGN